MKPNHTTSTEHGHRRVLQRPAQDGLLADVQQLRHLGGASPRFATINHLLAGVSFFFRLDTGKVAIFKGQLPD